MCRRGWHEVVVVFGKNYKIAILANVRESAAHRLRICAAHRAAEREWTKMPMIFDEALGQLIRKRLQEDKRTAGATLDVSCCDGCICLLGHVDTEEQKDAAVFLVEGLTGVRSVIDQIIVRQTGLTRGI